MIELHEIFLLDENAFGEIELKQQSFLNQIAFAELQKNSLRDILTEQ